MKQSQEDLIEENTRLRADLQDLSINQIFKGNSVSYIYDKMRCYRRQVGIAGEIMRKHNLMDEFERALEGNKDGN